MVIIPLAVYAKITGRRKQAIHYRARAHGWTLYQLHSTNGRGGRLPLGIDQATAEADLGRPLTAAELDGAEASAILSPYARGRLAGRLEAMREFHASHKELAERDRQWAASIERARARLAGAEVVMPPLVAPFSKNTDWSKPGPHVSPEIARALNSIEARQASAWRAAADEILRSIKPE